MMTYDSKSFDVEEKKTETKSLLQTSDARAVAEVQASYVIAKKFPRNESQSFMKIIDACRRPLFAEKAMYAYPKGGQLITGASIRLAELMARSWGNIDFGIKEINQADGVSIVEAYAIDLETNASSRITFCVNHIRDKKTGRVRLTDSRDIYELVANQAARRLRACILKLMHSDIIESAVEQVKKTLECSDVPLSEQVKKLILAFDEIGVKVEHIEKMLGHNLSAIISQEIVTLRGVYRSIKDGFKKREDFFNFKDHNYVEAKEEINALLAKGNENEKTDEKDRQEKLVDNKTI